MLDSTSSNPDAAVIVTDKKFYVAMGQRLAERRRAAGLTQQQLADTLGIAQQTLAHYEVGRLRVAAALLAPISDALDWSIEELLGKAAKASKRGPAPKFQEQIERIATLPRSKQRMLFNMLDAAINDHAKAA